MTNKEKLAKIEAFENEVWKTKNGKSILIKDLELNHLQNIVNKLSRDFDSTQDPFDDFPSFQGEMAQLYAEQQHNYQCQQYRNMEYTLNMFRFYLMFKTLFND